MKSLLKRYTWLRVLLYFITLGLATMVAGKIPALSDFWFFMAVSVVCSWLLLRLEGKNMASIHLLPRKRRHWVQLSAGIVSGCALLVITVVLTLLLTGDEWRVRLHVDWIYILVLFLTCLWSSIVQEFVFHGYPFQALLQHYGVWTAQWVIVVPFALMHMHQGMDLSAAATTLLTTGLGCLLFGLAYIKTGNLALPIGLHLGWNFAQVLIPRSGDSIRSSLLIVSGNVQHDTFLTIVVPYVVVMVVAIGLISRTKGMSKTATDQVP